MSIGALRWRHLAWASLAVSALLLADADNDPRQPEGYLIQIQRASLMNSVPDAPVAGDARDSAGREIFRATRRFQGTPRWLLAQHDDNLSVEGLFAAFHCVLGRAVESRKYPALAALLARVEVDSSSAATLIKNRDRRQRPFLVDEGPICVERADQLVASFDYPSGHSTMGWAAGLILAEMDPENAGAIMARARAYGESRIVCGVHTAGAVDAGRALGSALVASLHGSEAFLKDLRAAKAEFVGRRNTVASLGDSCPDEAASLGVSIFQ